MKKIRLQSLLFVYLFFITLLIGAVTAYSQTIDTITITPTNPTPDDEIRVDVNGTKTNACYVKNTTTAGLDTCGVRLIINMTRKSGCMPFPNDPVAWSDPITARVDPLPAGNYTIAAVLYEDGEPKDSMTTSFFVIDYTDITDVQIVQIRSSMLTNLHVDDPLTLMVDAIGAEETTILYRFYYRYGYGTPAWELSSWEVSQDWSTGNSTEYTFTTAGAYYVISHVKEEGTDWEKGDPQGGFVVDVKE